MTLTPVAFLSVKDMCQVLPVQNGSAWDRVIDMAFPLIQHIVSKSINIILMMLMMLIMKAKWK